MVAVAIGVVDEIVLMLFVGGEEDCALSHVCGDPFLLVAAELACVDPLLRTMTLFVQSYFVVNHLLSLQRT